VCHKIPAGTKPRLALLDSALLESAQCGTARRRARPYRIVHALGYRDGTARHRCGLAPCRGILPSVTRMFQAKPSPLSAPRHNNEAQQSCSSVIPTPRPGYAALGTRAWHSPPHTRRSTFPAPHPASHAQTYARARPSPSPATAREPCPNHPLQAPPHALSTSSRTTPAACGLRPHASRHLDDLLPPTTRPCWTAGNAGTRRRGSPAVPLASQLKLGCERSQ